MRSFFAAKGLQTLAGVAVLFCLNSACTNVEFSKPSVPLEEASKEARVVYKDSPTSLQSSVITEEDRRKKQEFLANPEVLEMSRGLEEIAKATAIIVEDKSIQDVIYAKCMEKFDGETNVLWQQLEVDNNLRN